MGQVHLNYGSPLAFLGQAFWDMDSHPEAQAEAERLVAARRPQPKPLPPQRSMTSSWETVRSFSDPPKPRHVAIVYADDGDARGTWASLCQRIAAWFR